MNVVGMSVRVLPVRWRVARGFAHHAYVVLYDENVVQVADVHIMTFRASGANGLTARHPDSLGTIPCGRITFTHGRRGTDQRKGQCAGAIPPQQSHPRQTLPVQRGVTTS